MENYKAEMDLIRKSQQELTSRIDAVIAKIEKPNKPLNNWYKSNSGVKKYFTSDNDAYGFNALGVWMDLDCGHDLYSEALNWTLMTPTEVQEALTKQILKIFTKGDKFKCLGNDRLTKFDDIDFTLFEKNGRIYSNGSAVYQDGIFATPIKTKTIEEIANEFDEFHYHGSDRTGAIASNFLKFCIKEKQTIIETLNNL